MSISHDHEIAALDAKARTAFDRWFNAPEGSETQSQAYAEYEKYSNQARALINAPAKQSAPTSTGQPDDVIARYLTLAGASLADRSITVDVVDRSDNKNRFSWSCTGCNHSAGEWTDSYHVQGLAQAHAATCRAIPRPAN